MNATLRRAGRGSTLVIGSLAFAFSLAACGGSESTREAPAGEETTEEAAAEEESTEEATSEEETTEEEAEAPGSAEDVTEEDLAAAKDQFVAFVGALGEQDAKKACSFTIDPETDEPVADDNLEACATGLEESGMMETFTPEVAGMITPDLIDAKANDDGTITLDMSGSEVKMAKASDGKWYFIN